MFLKLTEELLGSPTRSPEAVNRLTKCSRVFEDPANKAVVLGLFTPSDRFFRGN